MHWQDIVTSLALAPHPEGGFYRETFRDPRAHESGRGFSTAIYFLLPEGVVSRWHRVDAAEVWHWYAGSPLELSMGGDEQTPSPDDGPCVTLGSDLLCGQHPQAVVAAGVWQQARSVGAWTLVGCTVAPAFEFEKFEVI